MNDYEFSCWLTVHDPEALYAAALERAIASGLSENEARELLRDDYGVTITACLTMVLDPGEPPPGCEIISSETE